MPLIEKHLSFPCAAKKGGRGGKSTSSDPVTTERAMNWMDLFVHWLKKAQCDFLSTRELRLLVIIDLATAKDYCIFYDMIGLQKKKEAKDRREDLY